MKSVITFLQWLNDNYVMIITVIALFVGLVVKIKKFFMKSKEEQLVIINEQKNKLMEKVKECLLGWMTEAETDWGRFTGKIKRSQVMSLLFTAFPSLEDWLTTEKADQLIDETKKLLDTMLDSNKELYKKVYGHYPDEGDKSDIQILNESTKN